MVESRSVLKVMLLTEFLMVPMLASVLHNSVREALSSNTPTFQKGMSYTTYANMTPDALGSAESDESLRRMKKVGVDWVAINVVGWYQTNAYSADIHKNPKQAPTDDALIHVIQSAHNLSMKVMLKPMIDLKDGRWRGEIQPSHTWFENYTSYINFFAEFANQNKVEMFCVGTELYETVTWETEWRGIISGVRQRYSGPLTYAAVWWKEYNDLVRWWDALDYVGIDAYFPLSSRNDPAITEMKATWDKITSYIDLFYSKVKKPIVFTEIGFLAINGTNQDPSNYRLQWDMTRAVDLQEQADCYEATLQSVWNKSWFYGMYWWYWQTNPNAAMATPGTDYNGTLRDYTSQNKPAQGVITHWYSLEKEPGTAGTIDYAPYVINVVSLVAVVEAAMISFLWRRRKVVPKG